MSSSAFIYGFNPSSEIGAEICKTFCWFVGWSEDKNFFNAVPGFEEGPPNECRVSKKIINKWPCQNHNYLGNYHSPRRWNLYKLNVHIRFHIFFTIVALRIQNWHSRFLIWFDIPYRNRLEIRYYSPPWIFYSVLQWPEKLHSAF